MVLQTSVHIPSAGYPGRGYSHKEEYYKENSYNDGYAHKEDYYKKDYYGGSSSMQMMRPHSGMHAPSGPNYHMHGGHSHHNSYGHDGSKFSSSMYSRHGSMNHGYGTSSYGSAMPMGGPSGYESKYEYQHHGHNSSSSPFYQQHSSWTAKDLDD